MEPFNHKEDEEDKDVDLTILYNSWSVNQGKMDMSNYRGKVDIGSTKQKCLPWKSIVKNGVWPDYLNTEEKRINKLGDKDGYHNFCRNPFWNRERKSSDPRYLSCPVEEEVDGKTNTLDGSIFVQCDPEAFKKEVIDNKCIDINSWWKGKAIIENDEKNDDGNDLEKTKSNISVSSWQECHKKCKNSRRKLTKEEKQKGIKRTKNCKAFTTKLDSNCLNNGKCKCYLFEDGSFNKDGNPYGLLNKIMTDEMIQDNKEKVKNYVSFDNECLTEKRLYSDILAKTHPGFKKCKCDGGRPAKGDNCPGDGIEKCELCSDGYSKDKNNPDLCVKDDEMTREDAEKVLSERLKDTTITGKATVTQDAKRKQLERFIPSCSQCTQYDYLKNTIPHPDGVDCRAGGKGLAKEKKLRGIMDKKVEMRLGDIDIVATLKSELPPELYRMILDITCFILSIGCEEDKDCPQNKII